MPDMHEKPLKMLIIEDSEDDCLLLLRTLKKGGFLVEHKRVDNAEDLENILTCEDNWDVVVTDHNLNGFDSSQSLAIVKAIHPDLPVIIVSGEIGEDVAVSAMHAGAADYIMKGNLARLVPAIDRELKETRVREEKRKASETIQHMAYHDTLTNLYNRYEFERRLHSALEDAQLHNNTYMLLYMDLDQFKIVNDTAGHIAGDELLRQVAELMRNHVRAGDTLARLGGDEFGLLLSGCGREKAMEIAQTLAQAISEFRFVWQDNTFTVGVSIGMSPIDAESHSITELMSNADIACYQAKEQGRNRINIFESSDQILAMRRSEMQWVNRINYALENDRLALYHQRIKNLNHPQDEDACCEFLVRMLDDNGDIIPPYAFIPAAERYDLMPRIDRWVVTHVFDYLAKRYPLETFPRGPMDQGPGPFFINLSGASLNDERFFQFIAEELDRFNLPGELICFEVTETRAISNMSETVRFINNVKKRGCFFALDDFGAGMSSFSYLKTLPVDFIKIDGSFVKDILDDPMDFAIVEAITKISHSVNLKVIAEFVESELILNTLKTIDVDFAQGYFIEHPMPFEVDA